MENEQEIGKTIKIGNKSPVAYVIPILLAMQTEAYEKAGKIVLSTTLTNLPTADHLVKLFRCAGLEEKKRESKQVRALVKKDLLGNQVGTYDLDVFEITLIKNPAIR